MLLVCLYLFLGLAFAEILSVKARISLVQYLLMVVLYPALIGIALIEVLIEKWRNNK